MRVPRLSVAVNCVIAFLGLAGSAYYGKEFFGHAKALVQHSRLAQPAVLSTDELLNLHLERYLWDQDYTVHFLVNGGRPYSLEPAHVADTLAALGNYAQLERIAWSRPGKYLIDPYMTYLEDRMYLLGTELVADKQDGWEQLFERAERELGRDPQVDRAAAMQAAEEYVRNYGSRHAVSEAQALLRTYRIPGALPNEQPFAVTSIPDESQLHMVGQGVALPSLPSVLSERKSYELYLLNTNRRIGTAQATTSRLFADLSLRRRWMTESLLDDHKRMTSDLRARYFGPSGSLRLIPYVVTIEVGMDVVMTIESDTDMDALQIALDADVCCELRTDMETIEIYPTSIRKIGHLHYRGRTFPGTPIVRAVVSSRRTK